VNGIIFFTGETDVSTLSAVKAPTQCSLIPVLNVSWRQGEELGSGEGKAIGNGLFSGYAAEERYLAVISFPTNYLCPTTDLITPEDVYFGTLW
jgi:hypothetical protein